MPARLVEKSFDLRAMAQRELDSKIMLADLKRGRSVETPEQTAKRRADWDAYYRAERKRIDQGWRDLERIVLFGMWGMVGLIVLAAIAIATR